MFVKTLFQALFFENALIPANKSYSAVNNFRSKEKILAQTKNTTNNNYQLFKRGKTCFIFEEIVIPVNMLGEIAKKTRSRTVDLAYSHCIGSNVGNP